ncbi:MAG: TusE/DsrC/DsvC family sulfur relay protein [Cyclobacteriaceae bacterium]|nr:TusE/DsrC/DsvC family sulfur relay protein [Cyclobacteriaceae bacterium]UYN85165.1 MAG: TusE/DsrC/DsvC family sulfur relay protein [Cyclobacteriaceae bacterium]
METLTLAGTSVDVNAEGYLTNMDEWTPELAREMAAQVNIELTDKHFEVLNWLRAKQKEGVQLSIRKLGNSGIVDIKQFYALFPGGPLKISSKLAGIPKPASCI